METNETELLLCQACVLVTGNLTLAQGTHSSTSLCPPPLPVLAQEGNSAGS